MTDTPHLRLPLLAAAQAQKHVTHDEALAILDALLHLAVLDRDRGEPPQSPAEGDRYIVAQDPTGAWAGKAGTVAVFGAGGWDFHGPKEGWLAWVADERALLVHDASTWGPPGSGPAGELQNLALLGIGTTADGANPFSAKLNKALWTARTTAEGGNGDLRYTLNEAAAGVLSFLLQRGFEGRAEFGLIGDDDWRLKVSADGATWNDAIVVSRSTGAVSMPNTAGVAPAGAAFIVAASDGALTAERVATESAEIGWDFAAAGQAKATLRDDAVTNAKLADMAANRLKGRVSAGTGDPEDLTSAQATALLDVMGGSGASARQGLAPAPPASAGTSLFLREDATWAAPAAGGGGLPDPLSEGEPSTPASGVSLYARVQAGRRLPAWKEPSGRLGTIFPHLARTRSGLLLPAGGVVLQALGIAPAAAVGTATARNPASTNLFASTKRIGYVSAAAAGSSAEIAATRGQYWRGNAAGLGGFHLIARFGLSSAAAVAGQRCFVGLAATVAALPNADPSAIVDMVGVGNDSADTALQVMHNDGTGTATKVALGANFPANTLSADLYELQLFCAPNSGSIDYRVERLNTGHVASGTLAADLPASGAFLCPHLWVNNGATAAACAIDLVSFYVEADA